MWGDENEIGGQASSGLVSPGLWIHVTILKPRCFRRVDAAALRIGLFKYKVPEFLW